MMIQSQILQTLRAPESQARLAHIVAHEALDSRAAVGRRVCAEFGFVDARGSAQLAGCLKALNRLEGAGRIVLPAPRRRGCAPSPRCLDEPVAAATGVPGTVEAVEGLSLVRVEGTPAAPAVEYLAALRASPGHGDICRLPGALSGCFGARGARRGRVFGFGVAFAGARGVDGVERWAAPSPSAPGAVPEPVPDPPRRAMPQPGQLCAGPGAASSAGGFRGPLPVPPVAGRDLCRPCARRSQLQGGQLRVGRPHRRARAPGPGPYAGRHGQVGVYVRVGAALAPAVGAGEGRSGAGAGARRRTRQHPVDGERVWRGAVGRQAFVGASGQERGAAGSVARTGPSPPMRPTTARR